MHLRQFLTIVVALLSAAVIAAGCEMPGGGVPEGAICTVNGEELRKSPTDAENEEDAAEDFDLVKQVQAFDDIVAQAERGYETQGQPFPKKGSAEYKQLVDQAVDFLIQRELFRQKAEELEVNIKEKEVDDRLNQLKKSFFKGDEKKYASELKKQGLTELQVKRNIYQQLLSEKLFDEVTDEVKISDKEAEDYYEEHESQYVQEPTRDVAHILVKGKAEAQKIYQQVKGGNEKKFGQIAKAQSTDKTSAENNGQLTITKGQTVPEFDKTAFALKTGEVSQPVKTQFGYHIIMARGDVQEKKTQSFEDVKDQVKEQLEQEKRSEAMQDWTDDLLKDAEDDVDCKKGYTWTKTVKETETTPPAAETTPTETATDAETTAETTPTETSTVAD